MSEEGQISVAVVGKSVYVRPTGLATQNNSLGLPDFLSTMFRQGCSSVTFDLKDCRGMDSTFLGVIASAAMSRMLPRTKTVVIINASENAERQLRMIGLLPVVAVKREPVKPPDGLELAEVDFVHFPASQRARTRKIKALHEKLIKLNERNRKQFSGFLEMLEAELQQENGKE